MRYVEYVKSANQNESFVQMMDNIVDLNAVQVHMASLQARTEQATNAILTLELSRLQVDDIQQ